VIAVPTIPITADAIKEGRLPYLMKVPLSAAEIIMVKVAHEPIILSFVVAYEPVHPNFAFSAGVIWFV
jgi:hypothetical protein